MSQRPQALIHLPNIAANWRAINSLDEDIETAAVVKADAYGLGAGPVSGALKEAGCRTFFVAYAEEGEAVRKAVGNRSHIYVLNGPDEAAKALYRKHTLSPVLNTPDQYRIWHSWHESGLHLRYAFHFDTGMNRLGLPTEMAEDFFRVTEAVPPALVMSHLASAEDGQGGLNAQQKMRLREVLDWFPDTPVSLANSAATGLGQLYAYNLRRPGIALYGGGQGSGVDLKPAVTLNASILSVHKGNTGETVGYGATHHLEKDRTLATVALGYADGIPRAGGGKLLGFIDGNAFPVVGRISMDLITLDVSEAHSDIKAGQRVEFLGAHAKLEDQAARCGTLGYELLTGMGARVERIYETL